ncbi:unnamed protein product [Gadus morhua 'NCC']
MHETNTVVFCSRCGGNVRPNTMLWRNVIRGSGFVFRLVYSVEFPDRNRQLPELVPSHLPLRRASPTARLKSGVNASRQLLKVRGQGSVSLLMATEGQLNRNVINTSREGRMLVRREASRQVAIRGQSKDKLDLTGHSWGLDPWFNGAGSLLLEPIMVLVFLMGGAGGLSSTSPLSDIFS